MDIDAPTQIAFLGLAERAGLVRDLGTALVKWNVLGLKPILLVNFLPIRLNHLILGFAFRNIGNVPLDLRLKNEDQTKVVGTIKISLAPTDELPSVIRETNALTLLHVPLGWVLSFFPIEGEPVIIETPGRYFVVLHKSDNSEEIVGEFQIVQVEPAPLTPERIAAIKTDPNAAKAVRGEVSCKHCTSKLQLYAGLERQSELEQQGYIWYQNIPDRFMCECGQTSIDVSTMKRNFFAPLGQTFVRQGDEIRYEPRYEESALNNIRSDFLALLNSTPSEETLQKFIEQNPILLHQFPANKLFLKPPILTFFNADFAVVTSEKELILIEIEKAQTRLLKKDGGEAAELRHAFDQVHSWLHIIDEHRLAVLDSLKIGKETVSVVRAVVIAGRDRGYDAEHLRRLKGIDRGRARLLTYDDLVFGLTSIIDRMKHI
jgi:hypothetical protein